MDSNETKEDESQGTDKDVEKSHAETELDKVESSNVASSTTDESYPAFEVIKENVYLGNKKKRVNKEIRRMSCDCPYSPEEHEFIGCGDDCLNRLLMIECNNRCPCGESCSNRKFQEGQKVEVVAFKTLKKGWGLRTLEDISANQFVMEYCGEVMGYEEFEKRVEVYDKENRRHYYFMTLRADEIIDATHKGNLSRFINHSCSPNCETQKWTVNGYLRIGFFSIKDIKAGTELTFDYKFQRYGKKAQICYCESPNCRGIIGGEKHTPLKSIISGRAVSPARTSSPRRNRRRRLVEQWDDKPLEIEISQLLASEKGIRTDEQALKLSQFMVRAETPQQRILLLDTLLATDDQNCLRSFLRYQGMLLLWSWMVDLGENSLRFQKKIVHVLKHLPVANLNQVKDTKVLKVISKWARKPSVSCVPEEDTSSSDVDSRGRSPFELQDDTGRREGDVISSSVDTTFVREDLQNACKPQGMDIQSVTGPVVDNSLDMSKIKALDGSSVTAMETEGGIAITITSETEKHDETTEDDSVFKASEVKTDAMRLTVEPNRTVSALMVDTPGIGDSSEEESRWSEDDAVSTDSEGIVDLAADLLDTWSNLKEVYRIPKKSTIVVKREPESTSGESEAVVSEPSNTRVELKIPVMPTIEGDLFQKDEFLSQLGERELVDRKPFQQDSTVNPSDVPPPINTSVLTTSEPDEGSHDTNKLPIHQRLQMVATGGNAPKQYPIWHAKAGRRARKHPYNAGGGAFQSGPDKWAPRNQAGGKPRFNHPLGCGPNLPMHPGGGGPPRPNMGSNQWQAQSSSSYPGGYQYPSGGCQQPSAQPSYPASTPNQGTVRPPSSYFPSSGAQHIPPGDQNPYQTPYSAPASRGSEQSPYIPGSSQLPAHPAVQTSPSGYQQIQQPVTQSHFPPFDPSKPPPNFVPSQGNLPPRQFASTTQFQNTSSQFRNVPPTYSTSPTVPGAPNYPLSTPRVHPQVGSQAPVRPIVEQPQVIVSHRHPNTASMVSSSMSETEAMDRGKIDIRGKSDTWLTESHGKSHDVPLPPDWKMAYDGEGRAYYYHVVTRQTQWEPPIADRSPPTPEIGYLGDELDSSLEMTATFPPQITTGIPMGVVDPSHSKKPKTPSTPPGSPPTSPVGRKYTTAAADTTDVRKGMYSPSSLLQGHHLTPEQRKCRETFRMKLSAVVVNYLNPYHKLDCKVGRITSVDDFKFLARKLTHGVMVKELSHLKDESSLACNDSVKIKTKEYIRHYMQKFGPVYKPS